MRLTLSPDHEWHIVAQNHGSAYGMAWRKMDYPRLPGDGAADPTNWPLPPQRRPDATSTSHVIRLIRQDERASIVDWLRDMAHDKNSGFNWAADQIEAGEHERT